MITDNIKVRFVGNISNKNLKKVIEFLDTGIKNYKMHGNTYMEIGCFVAHIYETDNKIEEVLIQEVKG